MRKPKVYLGGAITGIPYVEVSTRRELLTRALKNAGFEVVDPMADEVNPQDENGLACYATEKNGLIVTPEEVALMDLEQVRDCDAIFLDFDFSADHISRGAYCEMAFAFEKMPIYCWIREESVYDYPFVHAMSSTWSYRLDTVLQAMREDFRGWAI